ncbi:MAG: response regulator [Anaerovibrio sp.]|uniref:HD domain-containing phosphohydrolase n=1 Tax=Anaerovibrio sp. TaxID=1872532 RepID=UPI0025E28D2E|nr:HD domain-containing phosphohydrolase [Anaerovibrio sp.]MCR5176787.1 response regulator [Anaerovibrio sp.]
MEHDESYLNDKIYDSSQIIEKLSFLNTDDGLKHCMDDADFYLDIVGTFVEDNVLEELKKYYFSNDWDSYRVKVHALKSSATYIGAETLWSKAKRMEEAAKQGDIEYINLNHHQLLALYEKVLRNIDAVMPERVNQEYSSSIKKFTIFVVDDSRLNRQVVSEVLSDIYNIVEADSGDSFFQQLESRNAPDLILLDVHMPRENGHEIIRKLKKDEKYTHIPVVFMTNDNDLSTELQGFDDGAVDFIVKPLNPALLRARISRILELYYLQANLQEEVQIRTQDILDKSRQMYAFFEQLLQSLAKTIDAKDKYTKGHSDRVARYAVMLGKRMGYNEDQLLRIKYAGMLHDIGKIGIPDEIINKPSKLSADEFAIIKSHSVIGGEILKNITAVEEIYSAARWHHERYDGMGYPDGLKGQEIPEVARVICVADAYDAMTSCRGYRKGLPQDVVRKEIADGLGAQFDPLVGTNMLQIIDEDQDFDLHD